MPESVKNPSSHGVPVSVKNGFPDEALGDLYPFEDKYVKLDDGRHMHYVEMGRSGLKRPTILLLHGNPTWSFLYRQFIKPLSKLGRVVAVDHMGFGRSDHPTDPDYYTLDQHIANLEEFVEKTKLKRVIPVVQDWGGPIGLGWATRHPDKLAGLVVMNTWAFTKAAKPKLPVMFRALRQRRVGQFALGKRNMFVESMIPKLTLRTLTKGEMDGYRHPFPNEASRAGIVAFPRMIPTNPKHQGWATMESIERNLQRINVPVKLLWAKRDPAFPARFAEAFADALPNASETVVVEASHYLQEDAAPTLVAEIRDFVRSL